MPTLQLSTFLQPPKLEPGAIERGMSKAEGVLCAFPTSPGGRVTLVILDARSYECGVPEGEGAFLQAAFRDFPSDSGLPTREESWGEWQPLCHSRGGSQWTGAAWARALSSPVVQVPPECHPGSIRCFLTLSNEMDFSCSIWGDGSNTAAEGREARPRCCPAPRKAAGTAAGLPFSEAPAMSLGGQLLLGLCAPKLERCCLNYSVEVSSKCISNRSLASPTPAGAFLPALQLSCAGSHPSGLLPAARSPRVGAEARRVSTPGPSGKLSLGLGDLRISVPEL